MSDDGHRANVLVTSCLKTPVDPHTKVPLALYERERALCTSAATGHMDNRDYDTEREQDDSGSELDAGDARGRGIALRMQACSAKCDHVDLRQHDHTNLRQHDHTNLRQCDHINPRQRDHIDLRQHDHIDLRQRDHIKPRQHDHIDLRQLYFSNQEYYRKLEELKRAHLRTMVELETMYRTNLVVSGPGPVGPADDPEGPLDAPEGFLDDPEPPLGNVEVPHRPPWPKSSPMARCCLMKAHSALELRAGSELSEALDEEAGAAAAQGDMETGPRPSTKEHIRNMWADFTLPPRSRRLSSSSLQSLPGDHKGAHHRGGKGLKKGRRGCAEREPWKKTTVPQPFHMTLREDERRRLGMKTRSQTELENEALRRQLDQLTECQRQFRASPVPAHVRLPLFEELREREEERRRTLREREERHLQATQKPFSFLERERLKREQKEEQLRRLQPPANQERAKPFKAKPVPRAVYEAASGDLLKEEQLYRAIKSQMRAQELLHRASVPPSLLARRLSARRRANEDAAHSESNGEAHRPKINSEVPDFDASYRRFQQHLEKRRDVKPVTACEPFQLRTARIASHRDRILADIEKDRSSPRPTRWPYVLSAAGPVRTPTSSLGSSLSGSLELLPPKVTDAAKKRQEAVRKVLEQRRKAEEEEARRRETQKQKERKIQRMVSKRAQANDPHLALAQTCHTKLKEFRKQDLQRRKEYREEMRDIQQRVKGRPLLLEQVAQTNAKQAAEKRYTEALRGCGLSETFVCDQVPKNQRPASPGSTHKTFVIDSGQSDKDSEEPLAYRKVYLDDNGESESKDEEEGGHDEEEGGHNDEADLHRHDSPDNGCRSDDHHDQQSDCEYSEDEDQYSEDSDHCVSPDDGNKEGDIIKTCQSSQGSQERQDSQNSQ